MRLNKVKSKNATSYYIIRSVRRNGKNSSEIVRKLGTDESIRDTYGVDDVDAWANEQLRIMNEEEAAKDHNVLVSFNTSSVIEADKRLSFNVGYLFLQQIYYKLGLPSICKKIKKDSSFEYDLNSILSRLICGRILFPSSKLSCYEQSQGLMEQPDFELHHVYRALSVLSENSDLIQAELRSLRKNNIAANRDVYWVCGVLGVKDGIFNLSFCVESSFPFTTLMG